MLKLKRPTIYRNVPVTIKQDAFEHMLGDNIKAFWAKQNKKVDTWVEENFFEGKVKVKNDDPDGPPFVEVYRKIRTIGVRSDLINGLPKGEAA
jgi:hypothetical protein